MQHDETIRRDIEAMLRQRIGLNPESVGSRSILRAVKKGMRMGKMQGLSDYWSSLNMSASSFSALVESVVVPETSFFRNRASFVFLRQWVAQHWARQGPLRVLSLPCSTGEEPYSIAITLLEEGLSFDDFHIDAVDISASALEKAKRGIYSPYAFRRQTYRNDDKYFTLGMPEGVTQGKRITQRYFLTESVREKVAFHQGNVLDPLLLSDQLPYDIVFCRNLLIYFDQEARDRTFAKLSQLLGPKGLLFLGYAETGMVDNRCYQPVPYPQTFAYYKQDKTSPVALTPPVDTSLSAADNTLVPPSASVSAAVEATNIDAKTLHRNAGPDDAKCNADIDLDAARKFADSGDMAQASELCDRYLVSHPSSASAYLLRGELYQSAGNDAAAETAYEKAVYLDPQMVDALTHLMLLKEEKQDIAGVSVLRERLQRLS